MPRQVDRAAGFGLRGTALDESAPDLCTTCHRCEQSLGRAIEEITEEERIEWLASEAALGYVGSHTG